jgi:hypothetical protein
LARPGCGRTRACVDGAQSINGPHQVGEHSSGVLDVSIGQLLALRRRCAASVGCHACRRGYLTWISRSCSPSKSACTCVQPVLRPTSSSLTIRGSTRRCWPTPGRRDAPIVLVPRHSSGRPRGQRCRQTGPAMAADATTGSRPTLLGSLRRTPPAADQNDADSERYRWRLARRTLGIAQAHPLHQHIGSARAMGRQLGVNLGTVRQWLKLTPPDVATIAELSSTTGVLPIVEPPPPPWKDWDEVRRFEKTYGCTAPCSFISPRTSLPNLRTAKVDRIVDWARGS